MKRSHVVISSHISDSQGFRSTQQRIFIVTNSVASCQTGAAQPKQLEIQLPPPCSNIEPALYIGLI